MAFDTESTYFEYAGNLHSHTPYSDGTKLHAPLAEDAALAGLDFVFVTDHNVWVQGVEGYYESAAGKVLLLVGEEVHDVRREPQANHFLAFGAEQELARMSADPQKLIDATNEAGGFSVLAHPFDPSTEYYGASSHEWVAWDVTDFQALEVWNYMSRFKASMSTLRQTLHSAFQPRQRLNSPCPDTIDKWDQLLLKGHRIFATAGSDAHGLTYSFGPLRRKVFPYRFLFESLNVHLLSEKPLSGDGRTDKASILSALKSGRFWIGNDSAGPTKGFRFEVRGRVTAQMGGQAPLDQSLNLVASAPQPCIFKVVHNGEETYLSDSTTLLNLDVSDPGYYRIECIKESASGEKTWIISNPIFVGN